jgi:A/G-specific adenine glycosylase
MLQQTRVETVRPRYSAFLAEFPTPAALAAAPEEAVLARWSGLGYYARARLLRRGASMVAERHQGVFPRDPDSARAIPGVGEYTVAAILSISYDLPLAVVDGNVARVLSRLCRLEPPYDRPGARMQALAQSLLDETRPGDHNQAMMELGALICLPIRPACPRCPVASHCRAHAASLADRYPSPRERPETVEVRAGLFLLRDRHGRLLLEKGRWQLLPHLWMPVIRPGSVDRPEALPPRFRLPAGALGKAGTVRHAITKHRILLRVFTGRIEPGPGRLPADYLLVTDADLAGLGRSSIIDKALRLEQTAPARNGTRR